MNRIIRAFALIKNCFAYGLDQNFIQWAPSKLWLGTLTQKQRSHNILFLCIHLGPIFIKFGQIASTRPDVFPAVITDSLSKLQDKVPPLSTSLIIDIIESLWPETFKNISPKPVGSGSIAQVHSATLNGEEVVLKVLRPQVKQQVKVDLGAMRILGAILGLFSGEFQKLQVNQFIDEFEQSLSLEIDLRNEAANYQTMHLNFDDDKTLYIPKVYDQFTKSNLLVMELIHGCKISELPDDIPINRKYLAENGVRIFFTQVLRDRFFHADMHPGNIMVDISNPNQPIYMAIDFGIIGVLSREDTYYLGANLRAFFNRDYYEIARLHIESNWVEGHVRIEQFEQAIRCVCEPIYAKAVGEISFAEVLGKLINIARKFELIPQPQLLLLQKTLLNVEGIGRRLYPALNLWDCALPTIEQYSDPIRKIPQSLMKLRSLLPQLEHSVRRNIYPVPKVKKQDRSQNFKPLFAISLIANLILLVSIWR